MAGRAVGLECGIPPGDLFCIRLMTGRARQVAAMILRFVRQRGVSIIRRHPRVGAVTYIALFCGAEVILVLANCLDAVVAGRARTKHLCMVNGHHRRKNIRRVTVFADIGRLYMRLVLTYRIRAVMTAHTVAGDIDVVEIRR